MTTEERDQIKQKIESDISTTRDDIARLEELTKPVAPDNAIGRLSRMEALNSKSINEAGLESARIRLTKLENILPKVDSEDYGLCQRCKTAIPFPRLMYMPESTLCVTCTRQR